MQWASRRNVFPSGPPQPLSPERIFGESDRAALDFGLSEESSVHGSQPARIEPGCGGGRSLPDALSDEHRNMGNAVGSIAEYCIQSI